ncbi:MAG: hypothetical protein HY747_02430 [Elusimicrobia bacterium]|nr:hypothetical protein [Elusimicrobiota bacterium]
MHYHRQSSFFRSLKALRDARRLQAIEEALSALLDAFEQKMPPPAGLGLKFLRDHIWEIRSSIRDRVLFRWKGAGIYFLIVGSHDDIKRFLKTQ